MKSKKIKIAFLILFIISIAVTVWCFYPLKDYILLNVLPVVWVMEFWFEARYFVEDERNTIPKTVLNLLTFAVGLISVVMFALIFILKLDVSDNITSVWLLAAPLPYLTLLIRAVATIFNKKKKHPLLVVALIVVSLLLLAALIHSELLALAVYAIAHADWSGFPQP